MTPPHLLDDVNLDGIAFAPTGRGVTLEFLNMYDGAPCARLILEGVILFNYHNSFEDDDDAWAVYVAEVTCRELKAEECHRVLSELGYRFVGTPLRQVVEAPHHLIQIIGGEVEVHAVCGRYRLERL